MASKVPARWGSTPRSARAQRQPQSRFCEPVCVRRVWSLRVWTGWRCRARVCLLLMAGWVSVGRPCDVCRVIGPLRLAVKFSDSYRT
eukprot:34906-Prymnesium_polylepis.1